MIRRILLGLSAVIVGAVVARAQSSVPCPDFVVSSSSNNQYAPEVGADATGKFVVVWHENQTSGSPIGVFGQRYEAAGSPLGSKFPVSTNPIAESNARQGVAVASDGSFVVAWTEAARDVKARRYSPAGAPLGDEFLVNTFTDGNQEETAIAGTSDGRFVVVWAGPDASRPPPARGVFVQRFDAAGVRLGPERRVNVITGRNSSPSVAMKGDGSFVVAWTNIYAGIVGQRYDAAGAPAGPEFVANTTTGGDTHYQSRVAMDANGNFVVVWTQFRIASWQALGRRFDAAGTPQGAEFIIGPFASSARTPRVAFEASGGFLTTWSSDVDFYSRGIMARRYSASAVPLGAPFLVMANTVSEQGQPSVASTPHGFVATWRDSLGGGIVRAGVECARLYTVPPCRLVDTRNPPGPSGGPGFTSGAERSFPVTGVCGIPADARAVALTVTAVAPSGTGFFRLFPGPAVPFVSTVNFIPDRTRAGNAVVALGTGGQLGVRCDMTADSTGTTHLVLDVTGYFKR